jgi:hypothetical protein
VFTGWADMNGSCADGCVGVSEEAGGDLTLGLGIGNVLVISLSVGLLVTDGLTVTSVPVGDTGSGNSLLSDADVEVGACVACEPDGPDGLRKRSSRAA